MACAMEDVPSSQLLSEEKDIPINEGASEELRFKLLTDGRVAVYLNVRFHTNKFLINYKDDEEEREEHFPFENKEDFSASFSTTRQRCSIQTSSEGKCYVFSYRSSEEVPKIILTNLSQCCISVKDKCPCSNSSSDVYYLAADEDGFLYLIKDIPLESSKKALWHIGKAARSSVDYVIGCYNQNNNDSQYITVDGHFQKDDKLKLTVDGSQTAARFSVYVNTDCGVHFQFYCNGFGIGRNEEQNPTDVKWPAVLSDTAIKFNQESYNSTFVYLTCKIANDQGLCSKGNAMEGDRTEVLPTEEDPSDQSKHRLPLYENSAKEDGGIVVLPQDGKSSHPSEPSREIAPPGDHHPHVVRSKDRRCCTVM